MSRDKIILGKETYSQLKDMLESSDKENAVVALSCIEASDFKQNITYVLLMMKEANVDRKLWNEHAAETVKKYRALGIVDRITYKKILEISLAYKVHLDDIQFFMSRFAVHMMDEINRKLQPGDRKIEQLLIQINPNEQSRPIGESLERSDAEGTLLRNVPDNAEQTVE